MELSPRGLPPDGDWLTAPRCRCSSWCVSDIAMTGVWSVANVAGQAVIPVLVASREKILDRDMCDNATSFDINDPDPTPPPSTKPRSRQRRDRPHTTRRPHSARPGLRRPHAHPQPSLMGSMAPGAHRGWPRQVLRSRIRTGCPSHRSGAVVASTAVRVVLGARAGCGPWLRASATVAVNSADVLARLWPDGHCLSVYLAAEDPSK